MKQFGDELPVVTLLRIIEQIHDGRQSDIEPPQLLEAVREQFAKEFPGTSFPWNDAFVLEAWEQQQDDGG